MEPENLTPPDADGIRLEKLLRASAPPELPDDGFSARVLASLPVSAAGDARSVWTVLWALAGAAAGLAVVLGAGGGRVETSGLDILLSGAGNALGGIIGQPVAIAALAVVAYFLAESYEAFE
jgi:hypothetical protein